MHTFLLLASLENRFLTGSSISVFRFKGNSGLGYRLPISDLQYDDIEKCCMQLLQNSNYLNNISKTVNHFQDNDSVYC